MSDPSAGSDPAAPAAGHTAGEHSGAALLRDAIGSTDGRAADALLPVVYDELRKLAAARMAAEAPGHTLDATALVSEAYFRLAGAQQFASRAHFFAAAAEAMRRVLVESARRKSAGNRGGGWARVELDELIAESADDADDLLALDEALTRLESEDPRAARVVILRHFSGMTIEQVADAEGISVRTANRHWAYARAWLHQQLRGPDESAAE